MLYEHITFVSKCSYVRITEQYFTVGSFFMYIIKDESDNIHKC